ncbi:exodeoxyribonuclease VII large subunit [Ferroacidibacillus organovorans]|uniref:Exodeoxyribonuclease 7 large subunit n=1 Tax=Ferroacidibacillus organovorans TaxID=1765683 RepID=A0A1V4EU97_9BACL|nr:exodeoxyribonuclease VII large subunit [Ferroacidibacillus organovorans]OPG16471.1 exodeoxyribonuclease VII large subunit [Ferroacidibacillus organovorans]
MERVLSVFELTQTVKTVLTRTPDLQNVSVRGEISNFSKPQSGHLYFTLKDALSRVKVVMFVSRTRALRVELRDGMSVVVKGSIDVFERSGEYQMYADEIVPDGVGALYIAYEQLKEKLQAEGLFEASRKHALPTFPTRIALVTSPTGAAVRDMLTTLGRRFPLTEVVIVPVAVQGAEASVQIAEGIRLISDHNLADVMIVGRGGGSFEELFAFSSELVVRAIASSRIPVISAVGHETDVTLADFVADRRAPTPTGAAELATPDGGALLHHLEQAQTRMTSTVTLHIKQAHARFERVASRQVLAEPLRAFDGFHQRVDHLERQLDGGVKGRISGAVRRLDGLELRLSKSAPFDRVAQMRRTLDHLTERHERALQRFLEAAHQRITRANAYLELLNPLGVLDRGYAVVQSRKKDEQVITSIAQVQPGDAVTLRMMDGTLDCQVWGVFDDEATGERR